MKTILPLFLVLLVILSGCQSPNVSPTDTPTNPAMPPASSTPLPPAATQTSIPASDTPAPPATTSPTPLPPVPTADFTLSDILGTWTRSDPDRGDLFITFSEDGLYAAAHGDLDSVIHSGKYSLDGRLLTFSSGWNCAPMPDDTPGQYILRLIGGGRWLYFDVYIDECVDRPSSQQGFRWDRYEPGS